MLKGAAPEWATKVCSDHRSCSTWDLPLRVKHASPSAAQLLWSFLPSEVDKRDVKREGKDRQYRRHAQIVARS